MSSVKVPDISTRAVLVSLNISMWGAKHKDKEGSAVLAAHYGADESAFDSMFNVIPKEALSGIATAQQNARKDFNTISRPWFSGANILHIEKLDEFRSKMRERETEFDMQCRQFYAEYDSKWVPLAKQKQGSAFKQQLIPTLEQVKTKFHFSTKVMPVPNANDWRVNVDENTLSVLKSDMETSIRDALEANQRDAFERIISELKTFVGKLDEHAKGGKTFYKGTIDSVERLADMITGLNITDDPRLKEVQLQVRRLAIHDAKSLREDQHLRDETSKSASEILNKVKGFLD